MPSSSPSAHRRDEHDLVAFVQDARPGRKFAVDRNAQAILAQGEAVPRAEFGVQAARVSRERFDLLGVHAGAVTQGSEIEHAILHGRAFPFFADAAARLSLAALFNFPPRTSRLPPD